MSELTIELRVLHDVCEVINTPRSLCVYLLTNYGEWGQYLDLPSPSDSQGPSQFRDDRLVTEMLRKSPNLPLDVDRANVALSAFFDAELRCAYTNLRLSEDPPVSLLDRVGHRIDRILGDVDRFTLGKIISLCNHGPGATTSVRGIGSIASQKYDGSLHLTADLVPFYKSIIGENWWYNRSSASNEVVEGNRFTTVPKSAKTDRGICVEPGLNMFLQKGIGAYIRSRLKYSGLDLDHASDHNRACAQRAQRDKLATIDLSMASDTVSSCLVLKLFSERWFHLLDICRSQKTLLPDGSYTELEKWSSMGNGYTFELESLIFYSLALTIVPEHLHSDVTVFGDDIIVPQAYATEVIQALDLLGFKVNVSKSFLNGCFFESCGADFFHGYGVRPFYLKGRASAPIDYQLQIANKLRLWASADGFSDKRFLQLWLRMIHRLPERIRRCRVPPIMGDSGVICNMEEARSYGLLANARNYLARSPRDPHAGSRVWLDGFYVRAIQQRPCRSVSFSYGLLLSKLHKPASSPWDIFDVPDLLGSGNKESLRGMFYKPAPRSTLVREWGGLDWL